MLNKCCKDLLSEFNNKLADSAIALVNLAGKRESVMEEAAYRRAEMLKDVMDMLKEFALEKNK